MASYEPSAYEGAVAWKRPKNGRCYEEAGSLGIREADKDAFELSVTFLGGGTDCPGIFFSCPLLPLGSMVSQAFSLLNFRRSSGTGRRLHWGDISM